MLESLRSWRWIMTINLALFVHDLHYCIRSARKEEWNSMRSGDCTNDFSVNSTTHFIPRTYCAKHNEHDRREPGLFEEEFRWTERSCLCSKTYVMVLNQINSSLATKVLLRERLKTTVIDLGPNTARFWTKFLL